RRANCHLIWAAAAKYKGLRVPVVPDDIGHAGYKCYVFVDPEGLKPGWSRDRIMSAVTEHGVPCFSGSCSEVYLERCFQDAGLAPDECLPVARELGETSLMFLVHPTLTEAEMAKTVDVLSQVMTEV